MKLNSFIPKSLGAWIAFLIGAIYFVVPLIGTFEFSLRMRRGEYSFDAYRVVLSDPNFQATFGYSIMLAIMTIIFGVFLVVPTAYWVRLRMPYLRPVIEFLTLMPLVIPAIVIVFGYLRIYNSSSWLPFTSSTWATDLLLMFGYVTLSLPYMYRSIDTAMRTIDVRTLTEAAESLGASWVTIMFRVIFPNVLSGVMSGAFITFAIVIGEFTLASLLNRPAFGLTCSLSVPTALMNLRRWQLLPFGITWLSMIMLQLVTRFSKFKTAGN